MTGQRTVAQEALFYSFNPERHTTPRMPLDGRTITAGAAFPLPQQRSGRVIGCLRFGTRGPGPDHSHP